MRFSFILSLAIGTLAVVASPSSRYGSSSGGRGGGEGSNRKEAISVPAPNLRLVCEAPARLSTCQRNCDCNYIPEGSTQPDCSEPVCYDNCFCQERTPPPTYYDPKYEKGDSARPIPKYAKSGKNDFRSSSSGRKKKTHH
ncbi:hypothetical protein GLAREA_03451 [Glarea lozoyensis ATCC 20868]|uniref:Uncharacterized protein n=1 Tax=Glarea lozoyensis (strain ATCC 20868 / MF5171) TaxID=1116229 RepID=S3D001_GLAL2|nr:uncharacterized protein GLAREA_03451 [Glarea lozoyensis ATCC 20868]EPE30484.1 hypothetical protein GLAREA_03451 [Glarea lozoyensis ATCC 20868]